MNKHRYSADYYPKIIVQQSKKFLVNFIYCITLVVGIIAAI